MFQSNISSDLRNLYLRYKRLAYQDKFNDNIDRLQNMPVNIVNTNRL